MAWTCATSRSRLAAPRTWRAACSTRPITWTGSSTWTGWTPGPEGLRCARSASRRGSCVLTRPSPRHLDPAFGPRPATRPADALAAPQAVAASCWAPHGPRAPHAAPGAAPCPACCAAARRALPHRGVAGEDVLDVRRVDVEAVHDDDVSFAVDEGEEAVWAHDRDVAGPKPAAEQHLSCLLRLVPVAREDLGAVDEQLARLSDRDADPGIGLVDDARVGARQRYPDRHVPRVAVERVGQRRRRRLGQPISLAHRRSPRGAGEGLHRLT